MTTVVACYHDHLVEEREMRLSHGLTIAKALAMAMAMAMAMAGIL